MGLSSLLSLLANLILSYCRQICPCGRIHGYWHPHFSIPSKNPEHNFTSIYINLREGELPAQNKSVLLALEPLLLPSISNTITGLSLGHEHRRKWMWSLLGRLKQELPTTTDYYILHNPKNSDWKTRQKLKRTRLQHDAVLNVFFVKIVKTVLRRWNKWLCSELFISKGVQTEARIQARSNIRRIFFSCVSLSHVRYGEGTQGLHKIVERENLSLTEIQLGHFYLIYFTR